MKHLFVIPALYASKPTKRFLRSFLYVYTVYCIYLDSFPIFFVFVFYCYFVRPCLILEKEPEIHYFAVSVVTNNKTTLTNKVFCVSGGNARQYHII